MLIIAILILVSWYAITVYLYKQTTYFKQTGKSFINTYFNTGNWGEYLTYKKLSDYENQGARFLFNCYLPRESGETTEIDVLMIYKSGIYVFESKNFSGWIFGSEKSKTWTQTLPNGKKARKEHFLNPIMQNKLHIKWLKEAIGQSDLQIYSVIVFSERCTLKKIDLVSREAIVITRDWLPATIRKIDRSAPIVFSEKIIEELYLKLYPYTQVTQADKAKHIQNIQRNHTESNGLKCPKCGKQLVLRSAKSGTNAGKQFYGCTGYPKCRYAKDLI